MWGDLLHICFALRLINISTDLSIFWINHTVLCISCSPSKMNECKTTNSSIRTCTDLNDFKVFILSVFMKNVDIQLKLIRAKIRHEKSLNKSCHAFWMNNLAVYLMTKRQNEMRRRRRRNKNPHSKINSNNKKAHAYTSHYPLSMEFLNDTSSLFFSLGSFCFAVVEFK